MYTRVQQMHDQTDTNTSCLKAACSCASGVPHDHSTGTIPALKT